MRLFLFRQRVYQTFQFNEILSKNLHTLHIGESSPAILQFAICQVLCNRLCLSFQLSVGRQCVRKTCLCVMLGRPTNGLSIILLQILHIARCLWG